MNQVYDYVTERICAELENGVIPWAKNWKGEKAINYVTRKPYRGINTLLLPFSGEYLTFKQVQDCKGKIKKGAKSHMIVFFKMYDKKDDAADEAEKIPVLRYYSVFHLSDCDGIETKLEPWEATDENAMIDDAENIITAYTSREKLSFKPIKGNDVACYVPSDDAVYMPHITQFSGSDEYYSTAFHELTHSTGHKTRLDRFSKQTIHSFGTKDYSKEELVAEIGAAFLNNTVGIDNQSVFKNNVAYLQNWLRKLNDDKKLIVTAASQAQKAVDFILGLQPVTAE